MPKTEFENAQAGSGEFEVRAEIELAGACCRAELAQTGAELQLIFNDFLIFHPWGGPAASLGDVASAWARFLGRAARAPLQARTSWKAFGKELATGSACANWADELAAKFNDHFVVRGINYARAYPKYYGRLHGVTWVFFRLADGQAVKIVRATFDPWAAIPPFSLEHARHGGIARLAAAIREWSVREVARDPVGREYGDW
jgi:hypothetical protein